MSLDWARRVGVTETHLNALDVFLRRADACTVRRCVQLFTQESLSAGEVGGVTDRQAGEVWWNRE